MVVMKDENPNGLSPPPMFQPEGGESRKDPALYAPNGGQLITRNLNAGSSHPNPWRPPTWYETMKPDFYNHLNLTTWLQPALIKQQMEFEKTDLSEKLTWYGIRAGFLGNMWASWDILTKTSSQQLTPWGKVARWGYLVTPYVAMSTSYICTHHIINKMVKKPNEPWIYAASWVPAAAIWGGYKRSLGSFVRCNVYTIPVLVAIKLMFDSGFGLSSPIFQRLLLDPSGSSHIMTVNDPVYGFAKGTSRMPNKWQTAENPTWPVRNYDTEFRGREWELEPSWKKHLPEEDRNKGPATGL